MVSTLFNPISEKALSFASVIILIWFFISFILLFTGVAESIKTLVFTPDLIISFINL